MSPKKIGGEFLFKKSPLVYDREMLELWRQRFIDVGDPTEYKFGISVAGDYKSYERIKKNSRTLREYLMYWQEELEVKMRSDALNCLLDDVKSGSKSATSSAKFIEDKMSKHKEARRPTKKEQESKSKVDERVFGEIDEEFERVMGTVN